MSTPENRCFYSTPHTLLIAPEVGDQVFSKLRDVKFFSVFFFFLKKKINNENPSRVFDGVQICLTFDLDRQKKKNQALAGQIFQIKGVKLGK